MDRGAFDRMTRLLAETPTRRVVARALAGLAIGGSLVSSGNAEARHRHNQRKKCRPCQRKKHGKCRGQKPDGARCNGNGKCFDGKCVPRPTCQGALSPCPPATFETCCSGLCLFDGCVFAPENHPCYTDADCLAELSCIAYRCRAEAG